VNIENAIKNNIIIDSTNVKDKDYHDTCLEYLEGCIIFDFVSIKVNKNNIKVNDYLKCFK
jgi:hypothetical protein